MNDKCEHNTTIVKYDQGNVQVEVCTWGCGQTLIGVKDATGLTRTFTIAELSALRERVEKVDAKITALEGWKNVAEAYLVGYESANKFVHSLPSSDRSLFIRASNVVVALCEYAEKQRERVEALEEDLARIVLDAFMNETEMNITKEEADEIASRHWKTWEDVAAALNGAEMDKGS